jgi:hypothetical protein
MVTISHGTGAIKMLQGTDTTRYWCHRDGTRFVLAPHGTSAIKMLQGSLLLVPHGTGAIKMLSGGVMVLEPGFMKQEFLSRNLEQRY